MESLGELAPRHAKRGDLLYAFDAFSNAPKTQRITHPDDGASCRSLRVSLVDPIDKEAGDLQLLDREPLEVRKRRIARAEVVDRNPYAERAQIAQLLAGDALLVDECTLGDLEHQTLAGYSGFLQRGPH